MIFYTILLASFMAIGMVQALDCCNAVGPCINGACPTPNTTCLSGDCCQVPSCIALGPCISGQPNECPANSVCVYGECCKTCAEIGPCINGACPNGHACNGDIILLNKSYAYLVMNSVFDYQNSPQMLRYCFTIIWVFTFTIIVPCSPVPFVYRYLVFCRKHHNITGLHYIGYLSIPIGFTIIYMTMVWFGCYPSPGDQRNAMEHIGYLFVKEGDNDTFMTLGFVADANTVMLKIILVTNFTTTTIAYSTIIFCTYQLYNFFKESSKHLQKNTREAQAQITKALFCQMASPIVLVMIPLVYVVASMFFGISDPKTSIVLNMGFSWIPMLNCFTTTYFVKPYRDAVAHILCGRCFKIKVKTDESTVTSLAVIPVKATKSFLSIPTKISHK